MKRVRVIGIASQDFVATFFGFGKLARLQISLSGFDEDRGRSVR
jgi:hypothetical protein